MVLLKAFGPQHHGAHYMVATSLQFRLLLGLGALPTLAATFLTYHGTETAEYAATLNARGDGGAQRSPWRAALAHPELWRPLLGCGFCWFLYDFVYYGTAFNQALERDGRSHCAPARARAHPPRCLRRRRRRP